MGLSNNTGDRVKASIGLNSHGEVAQRVMGQDINAEITSVDVEGYMGKPTGANADFITTRTAATQFTCSTLPTGVTAINDEDIETVRQLTAAGAVVATYSRDDAVMTCTGTDPTTVTVTGATFGATDVIVLMTNINRPVEMDSDGVYGLLNPDPDNIGLIVHANAATPADANQTVRTTGGVGGTSTITSSDFFGLDTRTKLYGTSGSTERPYTAILQDSPFGGAAVGFPLFGKYQVTPTAYTDGDACPVLLDANGRIVLSSDIEIGAVELKDGDSDNRALITDANTARAVTDHVLATQHIDAAGAVQPAGDTLGRGIFTKVSDGTTGVVVETDGTKKALNVNVTDGTNDQPTMDAVGRAGYHYITDGTNTMPTMDAISRKGFVAVTDGTNSMPMMDAQARRGYVEITDGTNDMPTMDSNARPGFVSDYTNNIESESAALAALTNVAIDVTFTQDVNMFFVQNQSTSETIWVKTDGATALANSTCVMLLPLDSREFKMTIAQATGISFIASGATTNEVFCQGYWKS